VSSSGLPCVYFCVMGVLREWHFAHVWTCTLDFIFVDRLGCLVMGSMFHMAGVGSLSLNARPLFLSLRFAVLDCRSFAHWTCSAPGPWHAWHATLICVHVVWYDFVLGS